MTGDPVTADVARRVLARDNGCVAVLLGEDPGTCRGRLTLDHVKDQPHVGDPIVKRGPERQHRYRAPSDERHLVSLCAYHHIGNSWATSHRHELREYLRGVER